MSIGRWGLAVGARVEVHTKNHVCRSPQTVLCKFGILPAANVVPVPMCLLNSLSIYGGYRILEDLYHDLHASREPVLRAQ